MKGLGDIIHADHKINGVFSSNEVMEKPVKVTFTAAGSYSKTITDLSLIGQQAPVAADA